MVRMRFGKEYRVLETRVRVRIFVVHFERIVQFGEAAHALQTGIHIARVAEIDQTARVHCRCASAQMQSIIRRKNRWVMKNTSFPSFFLNDWH